MSESKNFVYTGLSELEEAENNLRDYNTFIVNRFVHHSQKAKYVLDFGAGIGTLSNIWRKIDIKVKITCLEIDRNQLKILKKTQIFNYFNFTIY